MIQRSVTKGNVTSNRNENAIVEDIRELVALANNPVSTGPLVYSVKITQTGLNPPVATLLYSDFASPTITFEYTGRYKFAFASGVIPDNSEVHITNGDTLYLETGVKAWAQGGSIYVESFGVDGSGLSDNLIKNASLTVKVYS